MNTTKFPKLCDPCGGHLTFKQLIECGEMQTRTGLANLPREAGSYAALQDLAIRVLDPVIDHFGMIDLTYGFSSSQLSDKIKNRIYPSGDQHAAHERNQSGALICERLGAAVDFVLKDECMLSVAQWVVKNTPFDRLYFYGKERSIHVSYGPDNTQKISHMRKKKTPGPYPLHIPIEKFVSQDWCEDHVW